MATFDEKKNITDAFYLALTVWREARGEPTDGKVAVAHSILNRVRRPSWWGRSLPEVVTKKWQYSSMTDPHDPQLTAWPLFDPTWGACLDVAIGCIRGDIPNPTPGADSYYDLSIPAPKWADDKAFVKQIGKIRFYNLDHDVETPTHA